MVASLRGGGESSVVVTTLLFLTTSTSAICRRLFTDVPAGSDVTDYRCPMCTSAEPYSKGSSRSYRSVPDDDAASKISLIFHVVVLAVKYGREIAVQ